MKYKQQKRYKRTYEVLEEALRDWYKDNRSKAYDAKDDDEFDEWHETNYGFLAHRIIGEIYRDFAHYGHEMVRIEAYLQGLGLNIPHTYHDILEIAKADGRFIEGKSNPQYYYDTYFKSMGMRLMAIADSYKFTL